MSTQDDTGDTAQYNEIVCARHGRMIFNRHDVYVGRSIGKYGEYSELELAFLLSGIGEGDIVVEAGANIGAHTVAIAKKVGPRGRVLAFEPQRVVFQTLCGNLALNSITNTFGFNCALSDEETELSVPPVDYARPANFGGLTMTGPGQGEPVAARRLDGMGRLPRLELLKIDVEGMEAAVLRGARETIARHRPALYVENDRVEKSVELIELIRSFGYRLYWHRPPLYNSDNYFGDAENVFPNIISVNMLCLHESQQPVAGLREVTDTDYHPLSRRG